MEKKILTNSGKEEVSGLEVEFTATQDLIKKQVVLNAYIKKSGDQVGVMMYKDGEQFYHTYNNPSLISSAQKIEIFTFLMGKIDENKSELQTLVAE